MVLLSPHALKHRPLKLLCFTMEWIPPLSALSTRHILSCNSPPFFHRRGGGMESCVRTVALGSFAFKPDDPFAITDSLQCAASFINPMPFAPVFLGVQQRSSSLSCQSQSYSPNFRCLITHRGHRLIFTGRSYPWQVGVLVYHSFVFT